MSKVHDVIVIGGGPAGSTAGALLAREGRDVLILEREKFPWCFNHVIKDETYLSFQVIRSEFWTGRN